VINPFDSDHEACLVLVNDDQQHSLWPASVTVPEGWRVVHRGDSRAGCLAYVEAIWTGRRADKCRERRPGPPPRRLPR
jgi:MbtH protein